MDNISKFQDTILKEYPRLTKDDTFTFRCHSGLSCFNKCCSDVNIFLTPYDVIRLKNRLGISSGEFLEKYTIIPIEENLRHPIVMLKMDEDTLNCPFVSAAGCTVYEDRPWSCRMYPIGTASPKENDYDEFYFLLKEPVCLGLKENKDWTILDWMNNQCVSEYIEVGELFKEISLHDFFIKGKYLEPVKLEMFFMVCYDIDRFRKFVFDSSFLKRFNVDDEIIGAMRNDDVALLKFGFQWLKFSLFGEKTLSIRKEYLNVVGADI